MFLGKDLMHSYHHGVPERYVASMVSGVKPHECDVFMTVYFLRLSKKTIINVLLIFYLSITLQDFYL